MIDDPTGFMIFTQDDFENSSAFLISKLALESLSNAAATAKTSQDSSEFASVLSRAEELLLKTYSLSGEAPFLSLSEHCGYNFWRNILEIPCLRSIMIDFAKRNLHRAHSDEFAGIIEEILEGVLYLHLHFQPSIVDQKTADEVSELNANSHSLHSAVIDFLENYLSDSTILRPQKLFSLVHFLVSHPLSLDITQTRHQVLTILQTLSQQYEVEIGEIYKMLEADFILPGFLLQPDEKTYLTALIQRYFSNFATTEETKKAYLAYYFPIED